MSKTKRLKLIGKTLRVCQFTLFSLQVTDYIDLHYIIIITPTILACLILVSMVTTFIFMYGLDGAVARAKELAEGK